MRVARAWLAAAAMLVACDPYDSVDPGRELGSPSDLRYQLVPSGDPERPEGILLSWTDPNDDRVTAFVVYSRGSSTDRWHRRAATTSTTFHDAGVPHLEYHVRSEDADGNESRGSNTVRVDERNQLPRPATLISVSLDQAVQLSWAANARLADPTLFDYYRIYSTVYDFDAGVCIEASWVLEGTTVSEDFLVTGLANGAPRCFAVTTVSRRGHESLWSDLRSDTPRYDARNVLVDAFEVLPATSGFRFHQPAGNVFGAVLSGDRSDIDFRVERRTDGSLWLVPVRAGVEVALYATTPVTDLTSIDVAPADPAFARGAIEAVPGYAYVFRMPNGQFANFGAVRVTHVGREYAIFDWAYQTDPGNPELRRVRSRGSRGM